MKKKKLYFVIYDGSYSHIIKTDNYDDYGNLYSDHESSDGFKNFSDAKKELIENVESIIFEHKALLKMVRSLKKVDIYED